MNELRNAIATVIELAGAMIDELDDATMQALADLLMAASERLSQNQDPTSSLHPELQEPSLNESMPSSNIDSFGYDDKTGKLPVRFLGDYPNKEGPVYAYGGVPKNIFQLFQAGAIPARTNGKNKWGSWWKGKVPSLGASLYTLIKSGNYPYQKLS